MKLDELEGFYTARFKANIDLPPDSYEFARGDFVFRRGRIAGLDFGGCTITGTVSEIPGTDSVRLDLVADPRTGQPDAKMLQDNGLFVRLPANRSVVLKYTVVDGKIYLRGDIAVGPVTIKVSAERFMSLSNADI